MSGTASAGGSVIRRIGFVVLAVAAVLITVLGEPVALEPVDTSRFEGQILAALADYESNNAQTDGAPQQAVVNGWIARDLLTIMAQQMNAFLGASQASASDPRIPLLLMLLVLAAALHVLTARSVAPPPAADGRQTVDQGPGGPRRADEDGGH
jgi:phospholipase/lecithinase/hemolysin